jgi:hypothetical protein
LGESLSPSRRITSVVSKFRGISRSMGITFSFRGVAVAITCPQDNPDAPPLL